MLPGPVGAVLGPLLVTPRGSDLVRRMVLLVAEQIWIIVRAIFLNYCHSTRASGSLPSSACCGWGEEGGARLFRRLSAFSFRSMSCRKTEKSTLGRRRRRRRRGGSRLPKKNNLIFCAFPRGLSCALTSRMKCATCKTGIAANTAADDHEAGRPGRGEDCFS